MIAFTNNPVLFPGQIAAVSTPPTSILIGGIIPVAADQIVILLKNFKIK